MAFNNTPQQALADHLIDAVCVDTGQDPGDIRETIELAIEALAESEQAHSFAVGLRPNRIGTISIKLPAESAAKMNVATMAQIIIQFPETPDPETDMFLTVGSPAVVTSVKPVGDEDGSFYVTCSQVNPSSIREIPDPLAFRSADHDH